MAQQNAIVPFKKYLAQAMPKIEKSLGSGMSADRFQGIAAMAINNNDKLADCARDNPALVLNALLMCASDGLMPDNREATMTAYNGKRGWQLTYNPMIAGLLKRLYQTGKVREVMVELVYQHDIDNDNFSVVLGDNAGIIHTPDPFVSDRGPMVGVYAIVKMLNGGVFREVMSKEQVMKVKGASSGAQYGPWSGPFAGEMWRKSVLRRCIKRCPVSSDVMDLFQRDDEMYEFGDRKVDVSAVDTLKSKMADKAAGDSTPLIDAEPRDIMPEPEIKKETSASDNRPDDRGEKSSDDPQGSSDHDKEFDKASKQIEVLTLPAAPDEMSEEQWTEFTKSLMGDYKSRGISDAEFDSLYEFELGAIAQYSSANYNRVLDEMNPDG